MFTAAASILCHLMRMRAVVFVSLFSLQSSERCEFESAGEFGDFLVLFFDEFLVGLDDHLRIGATATELAVWAKDLEQFA